MSKSAFRFLFVWALCLLGSGHAFAAPVAYVHELTGKLQLQYEKRAPQNLGTGGTIESGATLTTAAGTNAVVKFEDGQVVALQPDTRFTVRGYQFVKTDAAKSNVAFELLAGALRFATGVIGTTNRKAFKLTVGTATIGIRGTTGGAAILPEGGITAVSDSGALFIRTRAGESVIPANSFSTVISPNAAPTQAAPIATASPTVALALNKVRASNLTSTLPAPVVLAAKAVQEEKRASDLKAAVEKAPPAEKTALQRAADRAEAQAKAAADNASKASEALLTRVEKAGYVQAPPPAPAAPPPAPAPATVPRPGATAPATTTTTPPTTAVTTPTTPTTAATTVTPTTTTTVAPPTTTTTVTPTLTAPTTVTTETPATTVTPTITAPTTVTTDTPTTTAPTSVIAAIEALPPTAAGLPVVTQPLTQPVTLAPTVTTTPTATGSGSGGGGTASVR